MGSGTACGSGEAALPAGAAEGGASQIGKVRLSGPSAIGEEAFVFSLRETGKVHAASRSQALRERSLRAS